MDRPMQRLLRILDRIEDAMSFGAVLLLVAITLAVCLEVFMRYALNDPLVWVVEFAEYALLYICFLGAAWALREGNHVRVDVFLYAFSQRWRQRFGVVSSVLGLGIALVLLIWGVGATWEKFVTGAYKPTVVEFPSWIVLLCIPVGSLILALRFLRHTIEFAAGTRSDRTGYEADIG
ncbi:MAG: TRAP transporter small permease [Rhodospirillaceae bacterium]|nr:TRAP transporter small permease [Rhodospirillaceae bacterium]